METNELSAALAEINAKLDRIETTVEEKTYRRRMSYREAAEYMGVPIGTLYNLTYQKRGPRSYKPHKLARYFLRKDIDAWLAANRTPTTSELKALVDRGLQ